MSEDKNLSRIKEWGLTITFFPRITAPGSPWITIYLVPPRCKPVGARLPGSSKSFMIAVISWGLNWGGKKIDQLMDLVSICLTNYNKCKILTQTIWQGTSYWCPFYCYLSHRYKRIHLSFMDQVLQKIEIWSRKRQKKRNIKFIFMDQSREPECLASRLVNSTSITALSLLNYQKISVHLISWLGMR